jgi:hypothetical protein
LYALTVPTFQSSERHRRKPLRLNKEWMKCGRGCWFVSRPFAMIGVERRTARRSFKRTLSDAIAKALIIVPLLARFFN